MKKLISALLLLASTYAIGQERPVQPNTISAGADGKYETAPDTAVIEFNISVQEENSRTAYEHASQQAEQIRQILRANGIDPKTAQVSSFSLQPVYDYKTAKRKLVGYRVNAGVSLKLKDFAKLPAILQALADANVSDTQSLSYTLEGIELAKTRAVEDAYRRARQAAEAVAHASSRALGELTYASVDTFENAPIIRPMQNMRAMAKVETAPTEEFTPQTITVTAHVNALFILK